MQSLNQKSELGFEVCTVKPRNRAPPPQLRSNAAPPSLASALTEGDFEALPLNRALAVKWIISVIQLFFRIE